MEEGHDLGKEEVGNRFGRFRWFGKGSGGDGGGGGKRRGGGDHSRNSGSGRGSPLPDDWRPERGCFEGEWIQADVGICEMVAQ